MDGWMDGAIGCTARSKDLEMQVSLDVTQPLHDMRMAIVAQPTPSRVFRSGWETDPPVSAAGPEKACRGTNCRPQASPDLTRKICAVRLFAPSRY
jgi:hypothetical protein